MQELPFASFDMTDSEVNSVIAINERLKNNYSTFFDNEYNCDIKSFSVFSADIIKNTGPFIKINNLFYLSFIEVSYSIQQGKYSTGETTEFQVWGIMDLKKDYGHILIKPETFLDKIHEWVHPIELNFEDDAEFNKKFYVLADDKTKTALYLTPAFRHLIKEIPTKDFLLEIVGNKLIIGNKKLIDINAAMEFAGLMDKLSQSF